MNGEDWAERALAELEAAGRRRGIVPVSPRSAVEVQVEGRDVVLFSSNDYLGLSSHPEVREATARAALAHGMGSRGSALVCGYTDAHAALEGDLARLKGTEAALLFPTGYAANVAVMTSLGAEGVDVFSDQLNHASIIDGGRLARGRVAVYRHLDADHLEDLLRRSTALRKVVVTESVFSMEGDLAPLEHIAALRERHGFTLVLDEAHATLVLGPHGGGLVDALGLGGQVDLQVGTLSKAVGAMGGFVACTRTLRDWLIGHGRSLIFSTAMPLPIAAAARAALKVAADGTLRRMLAERLSHAERALGRPLPTPIVPIVVGDDRRAVGISRDLLERGHYVVPIRPPTVPEGTARLRITLSAAHTDHQVDRLVADLRDLGVVGG